jgi:hypothetical protein
VSVRARLTSSIPKARVAWQTPFMDHAHAREHQNLIFVAMAARNWLDAHCGCRGEGCELGVALARLDTAQ